MNLLANWLNAWWDILLPYWPLVVGLGVGLSVVSVILMPVIILSLPPEHFVAPVASLQRQIPWYRLWLTNLAGGLLVLTGILMLFLPGQGLLTILVGLILCRFPAKYHLERQLMHNRAVFFAVNWIRKRYHRPPFVDPLATESEHDR